MTELRDWDARIEACGQEIRVMEAQVESYKVILAAFYAHRQKLWQERATIKNRLIEESR